VLELIIGAFGTAFAVVTYFIGRREGRRSSETIREEVAEVPAETASLLAGVFGQVTDEARPETSDRGWRMQYAATVGYAPLTTNEPPFNLLLDFPVGAHSASLLVFRQDTEAAGYGLVGHLMNGVGASFHVRESTSGGSEVVTLDYVPDIPNDRSMADAPQQVVYYAYDGSEFIETGRGEIYDPHDPYHMPPSVRPFVSPEWLAEYGL